MIRMSLDSLPGQHSSNISRSAATSNKVSIQQSITASGHQQPNTQRQSTQQARTQQARTHARSTAEASTHTSYKQQAGQETEGHGGDLHTSCPHVEYGEEGEPYLSWCHSSRARTNAGRRRRKILLGSRTGGGARLSGDGSSRTISMAKLVKRE
jgi:hypothetical protein